MMDTTVFSYIFENIPEISESEVFRYAGIKGEAPTEIKNEILSCIMEMKKVLTPKACYMKTSVKITGTTVDFGVMTAESEKLSLNLRGCSEAFLFGVTLGAGADRLINRFSSVSPVKALYFQAIGAATVESVCDFLCESIFKKHTDKNLKPRFSPGYGDLELLLQKEFLGILDCHRKIGLYLTDGGFMVPSKSVTAIVGVTDEKTLRSGCEQCGNNNCEFKRLKE